MNVYWEARTGPTGSQPGDVGIGILCGGSEWRHAPGVWTTAVAVIRPHTKLDPAEAPLEAASACPGVYAKGAYPGYAGDLLVDRCYNRCYNANGANGRKYLVRALFDPFTSTCSTLV
ncbi:hypothetical protein M0R45_027507 [Rubus argutus]|uniref:Uncharacterized protein n=1 Tax=Rubus argutus TaxID=59490 RepID=A0AAW1X0K5_RUBAR